MKRLLLIAPLVILLSAAVAGAQEIEWEWMRQFGTSRLDVSQGVSVDPTGCFVAGCTGGTLPEQSSAGLCDVFVRRYDGDGNEVWTRQFGTASNEAMYGTSAISATSSGIYVAGYTMGAFPDQTNAGQSDVFIRKYTEDGDEVWTRQFGTSGEESKHGYTTALAVAPACLYVAGYTRGAFPGETNQGWADVFIRKHDTDGGYLWTRQFGSSGWDEANGVSVDDDGNVYVAGSVDGALPDQTGAGGKDVFVRKYSSDGDEVWTRQFGTQGQEGFAGVCAEVEAGGVYVAGHTTGAFPDQTNAGWTDVYVRKYDTDGNDLWTYQFGTESRDVVTGFSADPTGIYVAGYTWGAFPGQTNEGGGDVFVAKLDADGQEDWTYQFGTSVQETTYAIATGAAGIYVAGLTCGDLPGHSNSGQPDAFVVKIANTGTGESVEVTPVDAATGQTPVQLTYGEITEAGTTTLTTSETGPGLPEGFMLGEPPTYYEVSTTASYSGVITVCIDYTGVHYDDEDALVLYHGEEDPETHEMVWDPVDNQTLNTDDDIICGEVSSLSWLVVVYGEDHLTPVQRIEELILHVEALNLEHGIDNSLDAKLERAHDALEDLNENNDVAAVNAIEAFINEVQAQSGKEILVEDADALIAEAQVIIDILTHSGGGGQSVGTPPPTAERFALYPNYPSPFADRTVIGFSIPQDAQVTLTIHDVAGRTIAVLIDRGMAAGAHAVEWRTDAPTGIYFCRLQAHPERNLELGQGRGHGALGFSDVKKIILLR